MKFIFSLILLTFSLPILAEGPLDLGIPGANEQVKIFFEKEGKIYFRNCPKGKIIKNRKDCASPHDMELGTKKQFEHNLYYWVAPQVLPHTKDPEFQGKTYTYIDMGKHNKLVKLLQGKKAYEKAYGKTSVNSEEIAKLEKQIAKNSDALKMRAKLEPVISSIMKQISNEKLLEIRINGTNDLSSELLKFMSRTRLGDCGIAKEYPNTLYVFLLNDQYQKPIFKCDKMSTCEERIVSKYSKACGLSTDSSVEDDIRVSNTQRSIIKDVSSPAAKSFSKKSSGKQ